MTKANNAIPTIQYSQHTQPKQIQIRKRELKALAQIYVCILIQFEYIDMIKPKKK